MALKYAYRFIISNKQNLPFFRKTAVTFMLTGISGCHELLTYWYRFLNIHAYQATVLVMQPRVAVAQQFVFTPIIIQY